MLLNYRNPVMTLLLERMREWKLLSIPACWVLGIILFTKTLFGLLYVYSIYFPSSSLSFYLYPATRDTNKYSNNKEIHILSPSTSTSSSPPSSDSTFPATAPHEQDKEQDKRQHAFHHLPDFYGTPLNLLILGYIRPEYDYVSLQALVDDIRIDCEVAKRSLEREAYSVYLSSSSNERVNEKKREDRRWLREFPAVS